MDGVEFLVYVEFVGEVFGFVDEGFDLFFYWYFVVVVLVGDYGVEVVGGCCCFVVVYDFEKFVF